MFWIFLIYPGCSLAVLQTFICKKVNLTTFLTSDYHGLECPWGGINLELSRFETWSTLAWVGFLFMFVYPIGVPFLMWLVMRYHNIHVLAKEKIGAALLTSMIAEYQRATTNSSSSRLATTLGLPPGFGSKVMPVKSKDEVELSLVGQVDGIEAAGETKGDDTGEFQRRAEAVYLKVPEHSQCASPYCKGHRLPEMSSKILKKLNYPIDASALALEVQKWFAAIDEDGSGMLKEAEVQAEFLRIEIHESEVCNVMKFANIERMTESEESVGTKPNREREAHTELTCAKFIDVIQYVLNNSIDHFSAADICTLNYLFDLHDADKSGLLDLKEFTMLSMVCCECIYICINIYIFIYNIYI
jgi:hypothetical protein